MSQYQHSLSSTAEFSLLALARIQLDLQGNMQAPTHATSVVHAFLCSIFPLSPKQGNVGDERDLQQTALTVLVSQVRRRRPAGFGRRGHVLEFTTMTSLPGQMSWQAFLLSHVGDTTVLGGLTGKTALPAETSTNKAATLK